MKKIFFLFFVFFCLHSIVVAQAVDTAFIYKKSARAPFWINNNPQKLAMYLTQGYKDEASKVLALSYWICNNITYNQAAQAKRSVEVRSSEKVLKRKKAKSSEFSQLFIDMCSAVNIDAEFVQGYSKEFDFLPGDTLYRADYSWAVVKVNGRWYIMDFVLASSSLVSSSSFGAKIMWGLFRMPTSERFRVKKKYSPEWLYIKPDKAVYTHMPILSMFQLLEYPITIDVYQRGDSVIKHHISRYPQETSWYKELEYYSSLSEIDKFVYIAEQSKNQNPFDHRNPAFNYYFAVDFFKNKHYIEAKGRIFAPQESLRSMLQYANWADSLFSVCIDDNVRELKFYQTRSDAWKRELFENNRKHSQTSQNQVKKYSKQIQAITKLQNQNTSITNYLQKNYVTYKDEDILFLARPTFQRNEDLYLNLRLRSQIDSLDFLCKNAIRKYDSIIAFVPQAKAQQALASQKEALSITQKNIRILRNYVYKKGNNLPMVYQSTKGIEKQVFFEYIQEADSINRLHVDTLINYLLVNQSVLFDVIKEYNVQTGVYLKLLQHSKSRVSVDYKQDSLFVSAVVQYNENFTRFKQDIPQAITGFSEIAKLLQTESNELAEAPKLFKKDNELENFRHKQYVEYRKEVRKVENEYIKYFIKQNRENRKLIQRALK